MRVLINILRKIGKETRVYKSPDGTRVLVLPHGGRVLGLFAPGSGENFYWTHSALGSTDSANKFYAGDQWHNSGGDRTWLAPEVDLFFPKFPKLDSYHQPRALDPGRYIVVDTNEGIRLINRLTLKLSRSGEKLNLKITKGFGPAKNPLRYERNINLKKVEYAGYTQYTSLEITGAGRLGRDHVGLWNLIQMPHGGDLLIPTFGRAEPRHIFSSIGRIPPRDLVITNHLIRYRMCQKGEHKISVRAVSVCNRVGYLHRSGDGWALVIRNFVVNPSGEYVDVPWSDTDDFGYVVQACNVDSKLGAFSELEYHIPAIGQNTGFTRCQDIAQVWAFRASWSEIELITKTLLTSEPGVRGET